MRSELTAGLLLVGLIAIALWPRRRRITLQQAIEQHRALQRHEQLTRETLERARSEAWGKTVERRLEGEVNRARTAVEEYASQHVSVR
jgi:hypothetical protein